MPAQTPRKKRRPSAPHIVTIHDVQPLARHLADKRGVPPAAYYAHVRPPAELPIMLEEGLLPHYRDEEQLAGAEHAVEAYINLGRWIVECPDCSSAQEGDPADPRFLCAGLGSCANLEVGGAYRPVVYPEAAERKRLEALLLQRPDPVTRNWLPGESAEQLAAENEAHGLGGGE